MIIKFLTGKPEDVISRGFLREDMTQYDAVVVVRNQQGLPTDEALVEFIATLCDHYDIAVEQVPA